MQTAIELPAVVQPEALPRTSRRFCFSRRRLAGWGVCALALALLALGTWVHSAATPQIGAPVVLSPSSNPPLWSFGFVGDTQNGVGIVEPIFASLAAAKVEFVLHLGDIVENAEDDDEWRFVVDQARRNGLRLMPVVGNHDRLSDGLDRGEKQFRRFFPETPGVYYAFEHKGLEFLMLNSELSFAPWSDQGRFAKERLDQARRPTIVCLHRPIFTCGPRDLAWQWVRRVWLHGNLAESRVPLVLAGHHHYYERSNPLDGVTYVVSGGGSRKLHGAEKADERTARFRAGANHFGLVDVYADRMEVRILATSGEELDRFSLAIPKSADFAESSAETGVDSKTAR